MSEDVEAIRRLKHQYLRSMDLKRWADFADTLTVDATSSYGSKLGGRPLTFDGRDEIVAFVKNALGPGLISVHSCAHHAIDVDGDEATGSWALQDIVLVPEHGIRIDGAAYYEDRYRRVDGRWQISHTGYDRIYETVISLSELPGYRLTANMWATQASGEFSRG
jgi:hypothetical protein